MSSRNIAVRRDVYEALEREKRPRESFTKVLERLLGEKGPLEESLGAWGGAATRSADDGIFRKLRGGGRGRRS